MTQEDKQLLLKDISARLPYGLVIHTDYKDIKLDRSHCGIGVLYYDYYSEEAKKACGYDENDFSIIISGCFYGDNIKPYLIPMSSMTEEEEIYYNTIYTTLKFYEKEDWLNEHHFDYRGLIPMGLALEAPDGMYKTE